MLGGYPSHRITVSSLTMTDNAAAPELSRKDRILLSVLRFFGHRSLRFLQAFGFFAGWLGTHVIGNRRRRTVRRNLELCFPDQTESWYQEHTARCLISMTQSIAEFAKVWAEPTEWSLAQIRQVHNAHIFHDALAAGKGTIAIVPHYCNWEILNAWVNQHTAPIMMYKPVKQKGVDNFVREARSRLNGKAVPTDESGVRALFKEIKRNGFTAILPDHVPHDNGGIYAPFFGISTWTGIMLPRLVQKTKCRVIVMYTLRRANADGFEIFFQEPDADIYSDDLATATAAMNRCVENVIKQDPSHYQWSYKRFRKNESLPNPY